MMNRRVLVTTVALMCVLALTFVVFAQGQAPQGRQGRARVGPSGAGPGLWGLPCATRLLAPPRPEAFDRIAGELALTADQKTKAQELFARLRQKIVALTTQAQPVRDLIAELKADPTDAAKVKRLASQITKQEGAILQAELGAWMEFEKILTPDQRTKFWEFFPRRPGPGPGGPPRMRPAPPPVPGE